MIQHLEPGVRRLQEEVARDPGSLAFVPLADLYRGQGRLDIARRVCVRGLQRHPTHVEAHYILGRIYRDGEEPEKAYDEWDIALRLDPLDLASRRAIAFLCLERGEMREAERHLRQAMELDPDDPRLRRALRFLDGGAKRVNPDGSYWEGVVALIEQPVTSFVRSARLRLALVLDSSGRVVMQHGFTKELDIAAFATLAAGIHATSAEIARMIGQRGFSQLYQGRGEHQLFVGTVPAPAGDLLLLTVFGGDTTIGLVRALFGEMVSGLRRREWPAIKSNRRIDSLEEELAAGLDRVGAARPARTQTRR